MLTIGDFSSRQSGFNGDGFSRSPSGLFLVSFENNGKSRLLREVAEETRYGVVLRVLFFTGRRWRGKEKIIARSLRKVSHTSVNYLQGNLHARNAYTVVKLIASIVEYF